MSKNLVPRDLFDSDNNLLNKQIKKQRELFFNNRIKDIKHNFSISEDESKTLWTLLLGNEHPDYISRPEGHELLPEIRDLNTKEELLSDNFHLNGYYGQLTLIWSSLWKKYQIDNADSLAARFILKKEYDVLKDELANFTMAEKELASALKAILPKISKELDLPVSGIQIEQLSLDREGRFVLDSRAMHFIKNTFDGKESKKILKSLEGFNQLNSASLRKRKIIWEAPLFFYIIVAKILWHDLIREQVDRFKEKPPALTLFTYASITTPFRVRELTTKNNKILDENRNEIGRIRPLPMNSLSTIDASTIRNIINKNNVELLKSINFHRALRWQVKTVTNRYINNVSDYRKITVDGSFYEFAKSIGSSTNKKTVQEIREIIAWQQQATFHLSNGDWGHMLTYDIRSNPQDKRKKVLSLYLTDMLLPNFVFDMPKQYESERELRMLAPLLDMPPLVTRNHKLHAAQAAYQVELCIEMRKRAREIIERGGIHLPQNQKLELAQNVGLSVDIIGKMFDRWTQDGDDGPKMLDEIDKDIYTLSSHHQAAKDFIIAAGKMENRASLRGKASRRRKHGKK